MRIDAPAHRERRYEHVGPIAADHRDFDHRRLAIERNYLLRQHAFALDGNQHSRLAERHAHLEFRGLTRLIAFFLRYQVDAVIIGRFEPPVAVAAHPHAGAGIGLTPALVLGAREQYQFARGTGFHRAKQQTARIGRARAAGAYAFGLGGRVVSIEAAQQTPAARVGFAFVNVDADRAPGERLAKRIESYNLRAHAFLVRRPAFRLDAQIQTGGMQRNACGDRQQLAVGIAVLHLDQQAGRTVYGRQLVDCNRRGAGRVERQRARRRRTWALGRIFVGCLVAAIVIGIVCRPRI